MINKNLVKELANDLKSLDKVKQAEVAIAKKIESVNNYQIIKMYEVYDSGVDGREINHKFYTYKIPDSNKLGKYLSYRFVDVILLPDGEKFVLKQAKSILAEEEEKAYKEKQEKLALQAQAKLTKEELKALKEKILDLHS